MIERRRDTEEAIGHRAERQVSDADTEQRIASGNALRCKVFDDLLEGDVLIVECCEIHCADTVDEFVETWVAADVGAQHLGVDEESDEVVERGIVAAGHRRSERDVGPGAHPVQQCGHGRLGDHEHAGSVVGGDARE